MGLKAHFYLVNTLILFVLGTCLVLPVLAGGKSNFTAEDKSIVVDETDTSAIEQTLEHNFSPEDRARLRKALGDYAKSTDPEHNQIAQKRKAMQESVEARFRECNTDNDDSLNREEATHCLPQVARHFSYVDIDEDEVITLEELQLAQAKQIERQKAAEAKMEAQKIQEAEAAIKDKSKSKNNKQAASGRKRPI
jgi:hypothetical protein